MFFHVQLSDRVIKRFSGLGQIKVNCLTRCLTVLLSIQSDRLHQTVTIISQIGFG